MRNSELAKKIARTIFELGDDPESPCQRIQFMGGRYPDSEKDQGGLCERALASVIENSLAEATRNDD